MGSLAHHQLALHWGELSGDRWAVTGCVGTNQPSNHLET